MTGMTGIPGYLRFLSWVAAVTVLIIAVGYVPTRHLGGPGAVPALLAGCLIGALGSALGGLVIALRRGGTPADRLNSVLMAMLARLAAVFVLGAAAVLSGRFERTALLLWIAISYAALLVVDTMYALREGTNGRRE
jgi:hypothetical protein